MHICKSTEDLHKTSFKVVCLVLHISQNLLSTSTIESPRSFSYASTSFSWGPMKKGNDKGRCRKHGY
ncbi:hypothetical protein SCA6_017207 [Theobroma cacao]